MKECPLWFKGLSDRVLQKVEYWLNNYERGEVSATRKFFPEGGTQLVDFPTCYAFTMVWAPRELKYLVDALDYARPGTTLLEDFRKVYENITKSRQLVGGNYQATMNFYKDNVVDTHKALLYVKDGGGKNDVGKFVSEQKGSGGLWDLSNAKK